MQQNQGFRGAGISAVLCLSLVGGTLTPFEAAAQNQDRDRPGCSCVVSQDERAVVSFAEGQHVLATQPSGFLRASAGTQVLIPGRVVAGPDSSAIVVLGRDCEVKVDTGETAEIERDGTRLCVALLDQASGTTASSMGVSPELVVGLLAVGGLVGVVAAISDSDKGVSR